MGHDGQLYGPQHYQYPGPYYPPATPTNSTFTPNNPPPSSQAEVSAPVSSDQTTAPVDATKSNSNGVSNGNSNGNNWTLPLKPSPQNSSATSNGSYGRGAIQGSLPSGYPDSRYSYDGVRSPVPWLDCPTFLDGQHRVPTTSSVSSPVFHAGNNSSTRNHNLRPFPHMMVCIAAAITSNFCFVFSLTSEVAAVDVLVLRNSVSAVHLDTVNCC